LESAVAGFNSRKLEGRCQRMAKHKFKVGQTVRYARSHRGMVPSAPGYKISRLMPAEGREQLYRIKADTEAFDRVARESELSISALPE
jgi:hypothetical protein